MVLDSEGTDEKGVGPVDPIDKWSIFIVRGAIIGAGLLGFSLWIRNSRLFTTFRHVSQIPQEFYRRGVPLKGIIREVAPNGLLKVQHVPMYKLPKPFALIKPKTPNLNLRLAALKISSPMGAEYMAKDLKLNGRAITFVMVKQAEGQPDVGDADVSTKKAIRHANLGVELVRNGLARVLGPNDEHHLEALQQNAAYSRLVTQLLTCEKVAEQRGLGVWERSTWVERIASYPSTAVQIVRHSTTTKIAILCYNLLLDACLGLIYIIRQFYFISVESARFTLNGYRAIGRVVDRASDAYADSKRQWRQFRAQRLKMRQPQSTDVQQQHAGTVPQKQ